MISLIPGTTPQDTNGTFAVLALLADPAVAKKRLDELVAAAKDAVAKRADLAEAQKANESRSAALDVRAKNADVRDAQLGRREDGIKAQEDALASTVVTHKQRVSKFEADMVRRIAACAKRESEVERRERQLATSEEKLSADRAKFDADRAALDRKIAKAKELIQA